MNKIKFSSFIFISALVLAACSGATPDLSATAEEAQPAQVASSSDAGAGDVLVSNANPSEVSSQSKSVAAILKEATSNDVLDGFELADCAADHFMDVQAHPANSAYPDPELSVTCDGTTVTIQTNDIPNFEFVPTTPNALQAQDYTFTIPQNPQIADQTSPINLGGATAVTVNGLVIFGPTEAPQHGYRDPYLDQILDFCNGHTAAAGEYHFHARPECIYADIDGQVALVVGYSFDGFPILSPSICEDAACAQTTELQSSWQLTNPAVENAWEQHEYVAGSGDLDECNGMYLEDGSYVYFATDTFPYFMGCYVGEPSNGGGQGGGVGQAGGAGQGPEGGPAGSQPGGFGGGQGVPPAGGGQQGGPPPGGGNGGRPGGGGGGRP